MKRKPCTAGICSTVLALIMAGQLDAAPAPKTQTLPASSRPITLEAEAAQLNRDRVEVVEQDTFPSKQGVSLKRSLTSNVGSADRKPDLVFNVKTSQAGRYWIRTHAAIDAEGAETMRKAASKSLSLRLMISVDGSRPTKRVVFVPWSPPGSCTQAIGKFTFSAQQQEVRIWLP